MKVVTAILLMLLLACRQPEVVNNFPEAQPVQFCDLLKHQADLQQKIVRVQATYRSGFETSALGAKGCEDSVWADFDEKVKESSSPHVMKKFLNRSDKSIGLNVVVVGYLLPPNKPIFLFGKTRGRLGFGHMNAYDFQFHVLAIESIQ